VALREAEEETGITGLRIALPAVDLDVHEVPGAVAGDPPHLHLDLRYLVLAPPGARAPGNHESLEVRWVGPDDLEALNADASTVRLVHRGLDLTA
jgi:8-oxo-dGTP pyrophosphatase MutT (NUDIX family)